MKNKKLSYIILGFFIILIILALLADFYQIRYYQSQTNSIFTNSISLILAILTSLITILIALYFLLIEVLRNSYPKKIVNKFVLDNINLIIYNLPLNLGYGLLLSFIKYDYYFSIIVLDIYFVINLLFLLKLFLQKLQNKKLNVNKHSNKDKNLLWTDEIINAIGIKLKQIVDLEKRKIDITINKELKELQMYYDDALNKNHNYIRHIRNYRIRFYIMN